MEGNSQWFYGKIIPITTRSHIILRQVRRERYGELIVCSRCDMRQYGREWVGYKSEGAVVLREERLFPRWSPNAASWSQGCVDEDRLR